MVTLRPILLTGYSGAWENYSQRECGKSDDPEHQFWVHPLPVTLSKLPTLSESPFPHLKMEIIVLLSYS